MSTVEVLRSYYHRWDTFYNWALTIGDKRVKEWPLMQSPVPTLGITAMYLLMVLLGPKLMENRKPFTLRGPLIVYNLGVMLLNLYIGVELAIVSTRLRYNWFCQPVDYSPNPDETRIAAGLWWYYVSKGVEFSDTAFFILRKKNSQLTFLHIYHHSTMFCLWWIGIKWVAGGSSFLAAMMNSFVHVIMYLYYGLAALGPQMQKYLWWKKHITCIQLIQFSSAGVLGIRAIIVGCDFPLWMQYALVVYMLSFIVLFGQFYINAYRKKELSPKDTSNGHAGDHKGITKRINGVISHKDAIVARKESHAMDNGTAVSRKEEGEGKIRTRAQAKRERNVRKET
ncbi:very long chain fatty acid elongase 4-like isoform X2 [Oratosquilla oratoria]|uniref:very long chain fatty acid elongase 4-like isoform X2 n=1 Tax=Oratosquilla oratoria TaxID=337810 RepID=UPI003F76D773